MALIIKEAFSRDSLKRIKEIFENVVYLNEQDKKFLGCNLVRVGNNLLVSRGVSRKLIRTLERFGFRVLRLDISEYLKAGGSVKCVSLKFN